MKLTAGPVATRETGAPQRWSAASVALHWISAVMILALLGLGWLMTHADFSAASKFDLYQWHKSLGFLSLAFLLLRLAARLAKTAPPLPPSTPQWERGMALLMHAALYALLLVLVGSGWLLASAAIIAIPTRFFGLFIIPNLVGPNPILQAAMALAHYWASRLLIALISLHAAAALKHHLMDRDEVLTRMLRLR